MSSWLATRLRWARGGGAGGWKMDSAACGFVYYALPLPSMQIDELMQGNPGLKSRFSQQLFFPNFSCEDSCKLFRSQLVKEHDLTLSEQAEGALPGLVDKVSVLLCCWTGGGLKNSKGKCLEGFIQLHLHSNPTALAPALQLMAAPGWSNGRDIGTFVERTFTAYSLRDFEVRGWEEGQPMGHCGGLPR